MTGTDPKPLFTFRFLFWVAVGFSLWYGCGTTPTETAPQTSLQTAPQPEIPDVITSRFGALYPGAEDISWSRQGDAYEVAFNFKQTDFKVLFLADGAVERTKTKSAISAVPAEVSQYVKSQFKGSDVKEAMRVVDGFGTITWEVTVGHQRYLLTNTGGLIGILP